MTLLAGITSMFQASTPPVAAQQCCTLVQACVWEQVLSKCSQRVCKQPVLTSEVTYAGPVNIHENVQRAMLRAGSNHRDPWFPPFYTQLLQDVKFIFGTTKGTSIIFPGKGHLMF